MIRYDGMVLEPTGTFTVQSPSEPSGASSGLLWWHSLLLSVGVVTVVALAAIMIVVSWAGKEETNQ